MEARSNFYSRYATATLVLVAVLISVSQIGCRKSATSDPASNVAPGVAAAQALEKLATTYRDLKSYGDQGRLFFVANPGKGTEQTDEPVPYSLLFERPNLFRREQLGVQMVSDSKMISAAIVPVGRVPGIRNQILYVKAPAIASSETLPKDPLLEQSFTWDLTGFSSPAWRLLTSLDPMEGTREFQAAATLGEPMTIDSHSCLAVVVRDPKHKDDVHTYYIDKESSLLRRYEFEGAELSKLLQADESSRRIVRVDYGQIDVNIAPPKNAFVLEIPDKTRRVRAFVAPLEPINPAIGRQLNAFEFTSLEGKPVTLSSEAGKIVVLDFWFTTCPPCEASAPRLQALYSDFENNDRVAMYAVNIDPKAISDAEAKKVWNGWGAQIPILRDFKQDSQSVFNLLGAPTLFILNDQGVIQYTHVGLTPDYSDAKEVINRLLGGENVAKLARNSYEVLEQKRDAELVAVSVDQMVELIRTPIAPKSDPKSLKLSQLWETKEIANPGNLLVLPEGDSEQIAVLSGWSSIAIVDGAGKVLKTESLGVPPELGVSFLRTGLDSDGVRHFAASAPRQKQAHWFNSDWKLQGSFPTGENVMIGDCTLGDVNGDGRVELVVGFEGIQGACAIKLAGKDVKSDAPSEDIAANEGDAAQRVWSNRAITNVLQVAVADKSKDERVTLCLTTTGGIVPINEKGQNEPEIRVGNRAITHMAVADVTNDGAADICTLVAVPGATGKTEVIGLDLAGVERWRYALPDGFPETAGERIVVAQAPGGDRGWLIAAGDGSLHLLAADGALVDQFNTGDKITGMAMNEIDGKAVLIVASPEKVTAMEVAAP